MSVLSFYCPDDIGTICVPITETDTIDFADTEKTFKIDPQIVFSFGTIELKRIVIGDGLTFVENSQVLRAEIDGKWFLEYAGETLNVQCNLYRDGSIDGVFKVRLIHSNIDTDV